MRGIKVTFANNNDVKSIGAAGAIPQAFATGALDSTWFTITPPSGAVVTYGFIGDPDLPDIPSNLKGFLGWDRRSDTIKFWTGSKWITIAG